MRLLGNGEEFGVSLTFFTPTYSVLATRNYLGAGSEVKDKGFGFAPGFGAVGFKPFRDDARVFAANETDAAPPGAD